MMRQTIQYEQNVRGNEFWKVRESVIDCNGDIEKRAWALQNELSKGENKSFFQEEKLKRMKTAHSGSGYELEVNTITNSIWRNTIFCITINFNEYF